MPKVLLLVPHIRQRGDGDCLAACAGMVLAYLDHPATYGELLRELKVKSYGAPASNIKLLARWNLTIAYSIADLTGLETLLQNGHPVIVFVRTGELPYWQIKTDHAIVVVGYDSANIYVNDPDFDDVPIAIDRGDFELAWLERDYFYALISN